MGNTGSVLAEASLLHLNDSPVNTITASAVGGGISNDT